MNSQFSLVILTYNEEIHLPRLLKSVSELNAPVFILDSGSSDSTLTVAKEYNAVVLSHPFENHPKQWDFALNNFDIKTPWVICLDADQVVTPELKTKLLNFSDEAHKSIDGIYFNRKNYFKGRWIKHGGYYPFYLLKMIRFGVGFSDLNENMDHRFIVPGKTEVWKDGHILEENLKENNISFWINKHNRYSDLVAHEEVERLLNLRLQTVKPNFWGSPDERTARLKQLWWQLPRYTRPMLYFIYRLFFQLGILDGRDGVIFHFLQGYWFRLVVDIKMDEILKQQHPEKLTQKNASPLKFILRFLIMFLVFNYFNVWFFSITTPGNNYNSFLTDHLNYIQWLRWILLHSSKGLLNLMGFTAICDDQHLLVAGHYTIEVVYSCLGLGVISFFTAFVLAYPKALKPKLIFLFAGILVIEILNVIRFMLLALYWNDTDRNTIDHHTIFNIIIYIVIAVSLYFWVKNRASEKVNYAAN